MQDYKAITENDGDNGPDANSVGAHIGRISAILEQLRDDEGRTPEGRLWAILATDAEKLLALAIGFGVASILAPERVRAKISDSQEKALDERILRELKERREELTAEGVE